MPALQERPTDAEEAPFLATNMRSQFIPTRLGSTGLVRYGFSESPHEEDDLFVQRIHDAISSQPDWTNRCSSLADAMAYLRAGGLEPRSIVVSEKCLPEISPDLVIEDAQKMMGHQGYVTKIEDVQVLIADIPVEKALVAAAPSLVGVYTRVGDYLGVLLLRADRSIVAVTRDLGG